MVATISSEYSTTSATTLTLDSSWIKDVANPVGNTACELRNLAPETVSRTEQTFYPLSGSFPVVVQGPRHGSRGSLTVLARNATELAALNNLLATNRTLLFQMPTRSSAHPTTSFYFRPVGDVSTGRISQPADRPEREVTFSYVEVAAP